jgi:LacI family transcriptional regulator
MEKRCTIKTIAAKLGVAPSTISRAFQPNSRISDAQRALILKTAKEMNYIPNQAASRLNQREVHIGILIQNIYPEGQRQILRGIEEAYRSFSDYKVSYHIDYFDTTNNTPQYYAEIFQKYAEYDGVIIAGIDSEYLLPEMEKYSAVGKDIVLLQSGPSYDGYLLRSVPNSPLAAEMAAEFLSVCTSSLPQRRVILLTGRQTLEVHREGKRAFLEACRNADMEVTGVYDMQDNEDVLCELLHTVLTPERLSETEGIYITSGLSIPLCKHLEACGMENKVFLVTTDSFPELQTHLLRGTVNASIYQNFFRQAWNAYEMLVKHLISNAEVEKITSPHPELILRANSSFYLIP